MREYQNDAELHGDLTRILHLRKIGPETFRDDSTGEIFTVGFEDPPTPQQRGQMFQDIYKAVIECRRARRS